MSGWSTRRSYDLIAAAYRDQFHDELDKKPFDRGFLDLVASTAGKNGWFVDLGSGPGQIGSYLASRGLRILNVDVSFEMLRQAGTSQVQADMRALPFRTGSIAGIAAFYSLVHISPVDLAGTVGELSRVLSPGGCLAVTTHVTAPPGSEKLPEAPLHVDQMLSSPVDLDFFFYSAGELGSVLTRNGCRLLESTERDPYHPDIEAQTRRAYVLAQKAV